MKVGETYLIDIHDRHIRGRFVATLEEYENRGNGGRYARFSDGTVIVGTAWGGCEVGDLERLTGMTAKAYAEKV